MGEFSIIKRSIITKWIQWLNTLLITIKIFTFLDNLRVITCQNYFEIHCKCLRNDKKYLQRGKRKKLFYHTRIWDKSTVNKKYIVCISLCKVDEWIKILYLEMDPKISAKRRGHKNTLTMVSFKVPMSWQSARKSLKIQQLKSAAHHWQGCYFKSAGKSYLLNKWSRNDRLCNLKEIQLST